MSIKLVTIDFWNTLFDSSNGKERNKLRLKFLIEETDKMGYFIKQDELEEKMKSSWNYFNNIWINEQRTPTSYELIKFLWKEFSFEFNEDAMLNLAKKFENSILDLPPKILPNVPQVLEDLRNNYKLAIVSDTGFSPGEKLKILLKRENILKYFDEFSFSDETGFAKPNQNAFEFVLNKFDIQPSNALHIGDIERTDVIGAKNIGMKAIRFTGDSHSYLPKDNPEVTIGDAETDNWKDIPQIIKKLS